MFILIQIFQLIFAHLDFCLFILVLSFALFPSDLDGAQHCQYSAHKHAIFHKRGIFRPRGFRSKAEMKNHGFWRVQVEQMYLNLCIYYTSSK